jgi:hypothetical protein
MKRTALFAALAFAATTAFAFTCPQRMKAIDEALPKAKLDAAKTAEVKKLRAEGEQQHKAGKHPEAEAALGKAQAILGIK